MKVNPESFVWYLFVAACGIGFWFVVYSFF